MKSIQKYDAVLIGAGIMSSTLATFLKILNPNISIKIIERMESAGLESSGSLNNSGTGHAGFCELNYTVEKDNGVIDITKAINVNESFNKSIEFWKYLSDNKFISPDFIHKVPHVSFVTGSDNVEYLKKRYESMKLHTNFKNMVFSDDLDVLKDWLPLVMNGRDKSIPIAATKVDEGTDVDFGFLTQELLNYLSSTVDIQYNSEVTSLKKKDDNWIITIKDRNLNKKEIIESNFVFIGAGGAALTLLEKSDIEEAKGYGGFPVSGKWLICDNPKIVEQHFAKVYGKASVGAPPMSVPHLDTRIINGKKSLLFGPYAGLTSKFLKNGSSTDLFSSLTPSNIHPMLSAGMHNISLTKYLIQQAMLSDEDRFDMLLDYYPTANKNDWRLEDAGLRVQIIKRGEKETGVIEFGTEVICSKDKTLSALLGASPGASTSVEIMLELLERCFPDLIKNDLIKKMVPSYEK